MCNVLCALGAKICQIYWQQYKTEIYSFFDGIDILLVNN